LPSINVHCLGIIDYYFLLVRDFLCRTLLYLINYNLCLTLTTKTLKGPGSSYFPLSCRPFFSSYDTLPLMASNTVFSPAQAAAQAATAATALQQYANNLFSTTANNQVGLLLVSGQELLPFLRTELQNQLLSLPGSNVEFNLGRITTAQILQFRPSYINAILIQSRGSDVVRPCTYCEHRGPSPFPYCRQLPDFDGCCGNCKWRDHASRCSLRTNSNRLTGSSSAPQLPPPPLPPASGSSGEPGTAMNPLLLSP
jgi:hypothetical protein